VEQRGLIVWALRDHARPPNETNLDTHYLIPSAGLWSLTRNSSARSVPITPRSASMMAGVSYESGPRKLISNTPASPETFMTLAVEPKPPAPPSPHVQPTLPADLLSKLRWANVGWHYHWGTKQYDFSRGKIPVDDRLTYLCQTIVCNLPWEEVYKDDQQDWGDDAEKWRAWEEGYEPDAGIVNFYQTKVFTALYQAGANLES
jgi:hypothetical protein